MWKNRKQRLKDLQYDMHANLIWPAQIYLKDLDACFFRLAGNPSLGRECSEVRTSYHKFPTGSYVIYYRSISKSQVVIVRILHESMDVEIQFTRRQEEPH